jgi:hypothetical protein
MQLFLQLGLVRGLVFELEAAAQKAFGYGQAALSSTLVMQVHTPHPPAGDLQCRSPVTPTPA